jgi:hypothetical protein
VQLTAARAMIAPPQLTATVRRWQATVRAVASAKGKIMRRIAVAVFLSACWALVPADASACTCVSSSTAPSRSELTRQVLQELSEALAVFVGEPIASNQLALRFRVRSVWKGEVGPELVMSSGAEVTMDGLISSSSCNFSFRAGETYVVFASGTTPTRMRARSCTFTSQIEHSQILGVLDDIASRRTPSPSVAAAQVVAVVGSVRSPGLVAWREGLTVADAIQLAGGAIPPIRQEFVGLVSKVRRVRHVIEDYEAFLTTRLLPDDQLFVAGPMRVDTKTNR